MPWTMRDFLGSYTIDFMQSASAAEAAMLSEPAYHCLQQDIEIAMRQWMGETGRRWIREGGYSQAEKASGNS